MSNATVTEGEVSRFDVRSADETPLAVWVSGSGPALVMVHGSIADHTTLDPFVEVLRENLTTFSMDRRGFGASGDGPVYAIERDFEDVAVVVDAVTARTGGPVALWGHSYGANCAMGGAARTDNVHYPPRAVRTIARHCNGTSLCYPGQDHWIMDQPGWEGPAGDIADWLAKLRRE